MNLPKLTPSFQPTKENIEKFKTPAVLKRVGFK